MRYSKEGARIAAFCLTAATALLYPACSTVKSVLAVSPHDNQSKPIQNPFGDFYSAAENNKQNIVLRTKKGDRSVEVELPGGGQDMTDFVVPVSPAFSEKGRSPASVDPSGSGIDETYHDRAPSYTDREIANTFPQGTADTDNRRRDLESSMGVVPSDNDRPDSDRSYLSALDHVKQLFKTGRYEAALMDLDGMVRQYPTDPKVYEMRGTLLDRLGHTDLALKSWNQALRLEPSNLALKRFVERKEQKRGLR
jgi:tetratricopeptide (TPR) repeat protein